MSGRNRNSLVWPTHGLHLCIFCRVGKIFDLFWRGVRRGGARAGRCGGMCLRVRNNLCIYNGAVPDERRCWSKGEHLWNVEGA